jgi:hypothetical protein
MPCLGVCLRLAVAVHALHRACTMRLTSDCPSGSQARATNAACACRQRTGRSAATAAVVSATGPDLDTYAQALQFSLAGLCLKPPTLRAANARASR